jgi:hypothetical protein
MAVTVRREDLRKTVAWNNSCHRERSESKLDQIQVEAEALTHGNFRKSGALGWTFGEALGGRTSNDHPSVIGDRR